MAQTAAARDWINNISTHNSYNNNKEIQSQIEQLKVVYEKK